MWQRNNGQAEDDLQFRFTAYLVSAVKRRRKDYLIQLYKRSSIESSQLLFLYTRVPCNMALAFFVFEKSCFLLHANGYLWVHAKSVHKSVLL